MNFPRISLGRLFVLMMTILSMTLVMVSWNMYQNLAKESQTISLQELLSIESSHVFEVMAGTAEDIGMLIQSDTDFREAFLARDKKALAELLDDQFYQHAVSSGGFDLIQLYVYDKSLKISGWSHEGPTVKVDSDIICGDLAKVIKDRQDAVQLKIFSSLCQWQQRAYFSVFLPIGGLKHTGYMQIIVDPLNKLANIESVLKLPLMMDFNGGSYYRSGNWQANINEDLVVAKLDLKTFNNEPLIKLKAQRNVSDIFKSTLQARNQLILFAGFLTLIVALISLWALNKLTLSPIKSLIENLKEIKEDSSSLGVPLEARGNKEIIELVNVYNSMTKDLSALHGKLRTMAFTDQLTALPNRTLFLDRLNQMILMSARKNERFAVMLLDLDGFKDVNDTLGHQIGDKLLQRVGARLKELIRSSSTIARMITDPENENNLFKIDKGSTVARLGGDEFAILLPSLNTASDAIGVAKRISDALDITLDIDGNSIVMAGTLGVAMYPSHGDDGETLLRHADVALYVAKHIQSDYSVYDPAYDRHSISQLSLKAELRSAIDEDQMVLYYQPKLNIKTNSVDSLEGLVRWQHPERGLIPPDQFIPLSEQRGLIGPLTEWVVKRALRQHNLWKQQGIVLQVAVNLSSRVLYDLSLPDKIEQYLNDENLSASALSLEITEDSMMIDPARALDILTRLSGMGLSLSIDDFGTGHSSLGYLKHLPVEEIKIDRTFVMDMEKSENDAKIVHATIDLAHNLGLRVVAEGVETKESLDDLGILKCDYAQGYYLSRPVPADELLVWLKASGRKYNKI